MLQQLRDEATRWAAKPHQFYIDGSWLAPAHRMDCLNPATEERICEIGQAGASDVDAAVASARGAFKGAWGRASRQERRRALIAIGDVLRKNQDELSAIITLENGKLFSESLEGDMPDTADIFDYFAGWVDKFYGETAPVERGFLNYIVREPVGVCGLIVPWNFPLLLATWKIAPALAMGNTVVIKPSESTSLSLLRAVELIDEADILPPGVLNVVTGDGVVGDLISRHPDIDKVSFTGSTQTGKKVAVAAGQSNLKTVTLELGGKAPVVVFADAPNFDDAVERCFTVAFSQKGEKCTEPTRILLEDAIYDRFAAALAERADAVVCGDPFDPASGQGAQCTRAQYDKIISYLEAGKRDGAAVLAGGTADIEANGGTGYFIRPTIFGDVPNHLSIAQDDIFGPVLALQRFSNENQAIELANDTRYGLAAGLYTADNSRAHRVAAALDAGQVFVNRYGCYDFASPFGGFKQSGWGKEMGIHVLAAYTRSKSIWVSYGD